MKRRIALKIGSNVLTQADGALDLTRMSSLVDQVATLRREGIEVIVISSGAVASGRSELHLPSTEVSRMDSVEQRQLFSAVGQAKLINQYLELFRNYHIRVGQVLTMKENFITSEQYNNLHTCMTTMLNHEVLPIVNENDTVCITELMFTDNDELSGLVAVMMQCDTLIILSNINGIYDGQPSDPAASIIREVAYGDDLSRYIRSEQSTSGRGGMLSKYHVATEVAAKGIEVYIANGKQDNILCNLLHQPATVLFTHFHSANKP